MQKIRNVKQLRNELKAWGKYWRAKQLNDKQSVSITEKACEVLRKGTFSTGTPGGIFGLSDNITIPPRFKALGEAIEQLSKDCKIAIIQHYIKNNKQEGYWIKEAERAILGLI